MAKLFTITPAIKRLSMNAIDTMITELGKDCLLVFDSGQVQCPNCLYDAIRKTSSGVYNGTGPKPFTKPPCPVCHGAGTITSVATTRVIRLLIDWQPKKWQLLDNTGTEIPQGLLQTKGYLKDMGAVLQAKSMIVDYKNATFQNNKFILWGEPAPSGNIVANRYFISYWERSV